MNDYKRLVSYIYSYTGGVRNKNVGFAKAEVRGGMFRLTVSLKGVYTDVPKTYGIYIMVSDYDKMSEKYILYKLGNVIVSRGIGSYSDILNPDNINNTAITFNDIKGIAVADEEDDYYRMFSLWEDGVFDLKQIEYANRKKNDLRIVNNNLQSKIKKEIEEKELETKSAEEKVIETIKESTKEMIIEPSEQSAEEPATEIKKELAEEPVKETEALEKVEKEIKAEQSEEVVENIEIEPGKKQVKEIEQEASNEKNSDSIVKAASAVASMVNKVKAAPYDKIFINHDVIDAFDDDYYYNCIEVSIEELKKLNIEDNSVINNSFLMHGYYNYRHILFGKVRQNDNGTSYFVGVPGMYCNRERFMASMYGFNNFKKSIRAEYNNPYFGYWYQEI